jgi:hypothetical protein
MCRYLVCKIIVSGSTYVAAPTYFTMLGVALVLWEPLYRVSHGSLCLMAHDL